MADSKHGTNFTAVHLGRLAQLDQYTQTSGLTA